MARFMVNTERVRAAAHECKVGAGQLAIAAECHREAGRFEFVEDSLLAELEQCHEAVAEMLQKRLEKASTILTNSAHALAEAARKYDASNVETASMLDPGAK